MLKQLSSFLLLTAFVAQTFSNCFVMLDYFTNTAAFAKNCENKARPTMHCNGKCQMMKKLQQEEKKDQQMPERKLEKKIEIVSVHSLCYHFESLVSLPSTPMAHENNYPLSNIAYDFLPSSKSVTILFQLSQLINSLRLSVE